MTEISERKPGLSQRQIWLSIAIIAALTAIALWIYFRPPSTAQYQPIINQLLADRMHPDVKGRIDLSKQFPGITTRDEMFALRRPDGSFVAVFPNYYAKGPAIAGLMFTSRLLDEKDTFNYATSIGFGRPRITIGQWRAMSIDGKIDDHWYRVSYNLH